jgi:predicted permease
MNNLSLLLWLSDVVGSAKVALTILSVCLGLALVFGTVILFCTKDDAISNPASDYCRQAYRAVKIPYTFAMIVWILAGIINIMLPTSNTIRLIAGTQVGEQVATTPEAKQIFGKVVQALNVQLDKLGKE